MLSVNEIFLSVQGEGHNAGMPAVFVRLAGCNLKCFFCDTDHREQLNLSVGTIVETVNRLCSDNKVTNVVVTGGEPLMQDDFLWLVEILAKEGYKVHVETNGTFVKPTPYVAWWTVSPKSPDYKLRTGNELKIVYCNQMLDAYLTNANFDHYYIQPMSQLNTNEVIALIMLKGEPWKLSVQMHKYLNLR